MKVTVDFRVPRWLRRPLAWRMRVAIVGLALLTVGVPVAWASHQFTDVPNGHQFHGDIGAVRDAGITSGKTCEPTPGTPPTYCPGEGITREAMAAFVHRGFGRAAWSHTLYDGGDVPETGQGASDRRDVGSVSITTGGTAGGTQFVSLHGKLTLITNDAFATYCTAGTCEWRLELVDAAAPSTVLDEALWRPRDEDDASTLSLHAVAQAPTATTKTYVMKIWFDGTIAEQTFTKWDFSLVAETFPFGNAGGNVLGVTGTTQGPGPSSTGP
jgi:hypothetical protein